MARSINTITYLSRVALTGALIALLLLVISGMGSHFGLWHFRVGFTLLRYGAYLGIAAAFLSVAALVVCVRQRLWYAVAIAGVALVLGGVAVAVPYCWQQAAARLPKIHDISTDTADPPSFVAIVPLRKDAPNPLEYGGAELAAKQAAAYPDLKPVPLALPVQQAFSLALKAAHRMGWRIVTAVPAQGRIEASDTTFWFGFTDDIVIRIRPAAAGALLDIRSVSRVGLSDVGTNAGRIRQFIDKLDGSADKT